MSKTIIFVIIGILIVIVGGFTGYLLIKSDNKGVSPRSQIGTISETEDLIDKTKVYSDESGFSFEYPEELRAIDVTPDDEIYYSKVEVSSAKYNDKVVVSVKDTDNATVDEWLADDPQMRLAEVSGATSLGGHSARQLSLNNGGKKLLMTVMVDGNILYLFEGPKDDGFWEEVQNLISSTFVVGERQDPVSSGTSPESIIYEEEEIVE